MAMQNQTPPPKKRRGCLGCFLALIVIIVLCAAAWFLAPPILGALGVVTPDAEELYSGAPDPVASEAVETMLLDAGIEGARATVFPIKGSDGQLAVITLDASSRTNWGQGEAPEAAFLNTLRSLSQANTGGLRLERTVIDVRDDSGQPFIAVTASQAAIDAYAKGEISRTEFMGSVEADLDSLLDLVDMQTLIEGE